MNYLPQIRASAILSNLNLEPNQYFIVSAHREENVDIQVNFTNLFDTMQIIAERYDFPIIVSTHPRTRKRLEERAISIIDERIQFLKFLEFFEYVKLQMNARCVISDSGTITEESSILNFPAVTIRQIQERPEGMDEATLIMCGLKSKSVIEAIEVVIAQHVANPREFRIVSD
jgi:UDP-N-acetylglucosamine 2-epimerase (non-hydrolysing)